MKSKKTPIAAVFNYGPHYRQAIYQKMGEELAIDFFLGDRLQTKIKPLDTEQLPGFKSWLRNHWFRGYYWQQGILAHFFSYRTFILTGEIKNLSSWVLLLLSKLFAKRIALWTHGWYESGGTWNKRVQQLYFRAADLIFTYSERDRSLLIAQGIKADKVHCIYNSLAYEQQLAVRSKLSRTTIYTDYFKNNYPVLLFIGRLEPNKKIDQLLYLLDQLNKQKCHANLVLIGGGSEAAELHQLSHRLKLGSQVWFYGPSYQEQEIGELLYNADLCVSPGNVGLTAMHALMYGLPVASHADLRKQMPEVEAIVEGQTGFLFQADDLADLSTKVSQWLEQFAGTAERREEIRQRCYKQIDEKYNPKHQIKILRKALLED